MANEQEARTSAQSVSSSRCSVVSSLDLFIAPLIRADARSDK